MVMGKSVSQESAVFTFPDAFPSGFTEASLIERELTVTPLSAFTRAIAPVVLMASTLTSPMLEQASSLTFQADSAVSQFAQTGDLGRHTSILTLSDARAMAIDALLRAEERRIASAKAEASAYMDSDPEA